MACRENVCSNSNCRWSQFSNETVKLCPLCGEKVLNFSDENPYESPNGDDYVDIEEW